MKRSRIIVTAILAILFMIGIASLCKLYLLGFETEFYTVTKIENDSESVRIEGGFFESSALVYSSYKLEEEGNIIVYAALGSAWNHEGSFCIELPLEELPKQVRIGGYTINADGMVISKLANELYENKNVYVGDASANGKLAGILGIGSLFGSFKNELQTDTEPYSWTLSFEDNIADMQAFEKDMKRFACVLMAMTDNLEEIRWSYTSESETGSSQKSNSMTKEDCSEYVGAEIKLFAESPRKVQELLDILELE